MATPSTTLHALAEPTLAISGTRSREARTNMIFLSAGYRAPTFHTGAGCASYIVDLALAPRERSAMFNNVEATTRQSRAEALAYSKLSSDGCNLYHVSAPGTFHQGLTQAGDWFKQKRWWSED
ncbi:hypothetical protein F441_08301 [Phytophthora nicotianae CJ01A1]|uniref:Uncharacterized protein n=4 Tax=Phytophthora nicotianae TaxID=4792 RepID=W2Q4C9_PHYN3|nr:hypothetical protein PPTG_13051 [Phytophthora nicotianae INRA-310]ETI44251.1 hypothetical protein F443_11047 [Phytophthora nicotianae P1569]ETK84257.1 hypothetical protein L915_10771 [Phytophthora nicotianae]ETP17292.1 hypothetical protein F441_08301 [Phytophthora nicotianae CJ01A1]ETL37697.1 hypothetical protein L916_10661 [Phytophthora nicotianae]ETL90847.1 hypothetical protein L917_10560 [Phytophthora nicotianae]